MTRYVKTLRIATSQSPDTHQAGLDLSFGSRPIGSLTLHMDDFADFVEGLRTGFDIQFTPAATVEERQKRADIAEFAADLPDTDEQDD
jgi:hypothetical protein